MGDKRSKVRVCGCPRSRWKCLALFIGELCYTTIRRMTIMYIVGIAHTTREHQHTDTPSLSSWLVLVIHEFMCVFYDSSRANVERRAYCGW